MKGIGLMTQEQEKVNLYGQMVMFMKGIGLMTQEQEEVN